jgi:hypothetical protein
MGRIATLLCAGVIMAVCFGCGPAPQPAPSGSPGGGPSGVSATCPDNTTFLSHVQFVPNGYDPSPHVSDPPPPGIGVPIGNGSPYAPDLQAAFLLAPPAFQARLCGLTAIYVNGPTTCSSLSSCSGASWGYRPANAPAQAFVAISAGLWSQTCPGGTPYSFSCFESDVFDGVFGMDPSNSQAPRHGHANLQADNFEMTILAALAHEVGHVRWYQVMNPTSSRNGYDPNSFCAASFFGYSWVTPVKTPPQWRPFAQRGSSDLHLGSDPQISTIDAYVRAGNMAAAAPLLYQLYENGDPWSGYFGAISPDEDFVGTYEFYILTNAQDDPSSGRGHLTSLPLNFSDGRTPYSPDIPKDYFYRDGKPKLHDKIACIASVI